MNPSPVLLHGTGLTPDKKIAFDPEPIGDRPEADHVPPEGGYGDRLDTFLPSDESIPSKPTRLFRPAKSTALKEFPPDSETEPPPAFVWRPHSDAEENLFEFEPTLPGGAHRFSEEPLSVAELPFLFGEDPGFLRFQEALKTPWAAFAPKVGSDPKRCY